MKPILGITIGDFNGIGPEIALKSVLNPGVTKCCHPLLIGSRKVYEYYARRCGLNIRLRDFSETDSISPSHVSFVSLPNSSPLSISPGKARTQAGTLAGKALQVAVDMWKHRVIDGITTGPTSKTIMNQAGFHFPGQTEMVASLTGEKKFGMMLLAGSFRVGLATVHVPLKNVVQNLSKKKIIEKLGLLAHSLKKDFQIRRPRIAVLGVNPHAGEHGLLGNEERKIILPAITSAGIKNCTIEGPFPADGFFGTHMHSDYDAVLAMYHDQGLIPLKMSGFKTGVNFSMGLPIVRTSPDHGTAYAIAGKNIADPSSMIAAIQTAAGIINNRKRSQ